MATIEEVNSGDFRALVVCGHARQANFSGLAQEIRALEAEFSPNAVYLEVPAPGEGGPTFPDQSAFIEFLNLQMAAAGYRRHPSYLLMTPYETLERMGAEKWLAFEKKPRPLVSKKFFENFNELLHDDHLDRIGRRSDAHCQRYFAAAGYIQPGDSVLDLACGLGYGAHILASNSDAFKVTGIDLSGSAVEYATEMYSGTGRCDFQQGNAVSLASFPDESIDFVASFETIEHVLDPVSYLRELRRVLKPGGRLFVSAPNDWRDDTGVDPNPDHLHVYDRPSLLAELGAFFSVESVFRQTAGGALRLHSSPRTWWKESKQVDEDRDSEWIIVLGYKDPTDFQPNSEASVASYWDLIDDPAYNLLSFARDYDNMHLFRALAHRGARIENKAERLPFLREVLSTSRRDSADFGLALCVSIYDSLGGLAEDAPLTWAPNDVWRYLELHSANSHVIRWQISIAFAYAEYLRERDFEGEDRKRALNYLLTLDPNLFSPLIASKHVQALHSLAEVEWLGGKPQVAERLLQEAVNVAVAAIQSPSLNTYGNSESPNGIGLTELGVVLDYAYRSADLLRSLKVFGDSPWHSARHNQPFFEGAFERLSSALERGQDERASLLNQLTDVKNELEVAKKPETALAIAQKLYRERTLVPLTNFEAAVMKWYRLLRRGLFHAPRAFFGLINKF